MILLAIDSAPGGGAALLADGRILARQPLAGAADAAAELPALVQSLLREGGARPDRVVVCTGPGSFTGIRAGLALAAGLALGWGVAAVGVGLFEALAAELGAPDAGPLWIAARARPGRIFLGRPGDPHGVALDQLPPAPAGLRIAGDAAALVSAQCGGQDLQRARPALAVLARLGRDRPPAPLIAAYIDPPQARLPDP